MAADVFSSVILLALNIGFICLGGYAMSVLETKGYKEESGRLFAIGETVRSAVDSNYQKIRSDEELPEFQLDQFVGNASVACDKAVAIPWTYGQSFNFALSVITTVGWGVMKPTTYSAKAIVCFYALFGIPIYGIFIALIKDKCGKAFRKSVRISRTVSWYWLALVFVIMVTIFLNIFINMAIEMGKKYLKELLKIECPTITPYRHWQENSTIWDGIYFGFITVSTIGFGDTYLRLMECEGQSLDSVISAVAGFFLFSFLLGMTAHMFDVVSEHSESGLQSCSAKISKRILAICGRGDSRRDYANV